MLTPKVLLVDDVKMFLEIQKGFLRLSSVRIFTAGDGTEALQTAKAERPDLIFMDLHMPAMGGAECCAALKANPQLRSIPVVMITAAGKEEDRELCLKAGSDGFLTKPLDRNLFLETARAHIPAIDRRETRVPCRTRVTFRVHGVILSGDSVDISIRGMYVAAGYEVENNSTLELSFPLPDGKGTVVRARARVAWLNTGAGRRRGNLPEGFGVEFVEVERESQAALKAFISPASTAS